MDASTTEPRRPARRGLRAFDAVLWVAHALLLLVTALAVPLFVLALTGRGSIWLNATIDPPYSIGMSGDRSIEVAGNGFELGGFPNADDADRLLEAPPSLHVKAKVDRHDTDSRSVLLGAAAAILALMWLGLVNLRRIVRAARAGSPFERRNAGRLRLVAIAVLAVPIVAIAVTHALNGTLEVDVPLHVTTPGTSVWTFFVIGAGLFALAEVFSEGAELQELEHGTI